MRSLFWVWQYGGGVSSERTPICWMRYRQRRSSISPAPVEKYFWSSIKPTEGIGWETQKEVEQNDVRHFEPRKQITKPPDSVQAAFLLLLLERCLPIGFVDMLTENGPIRGHVEPLVRLPTAQSFFACVQGNCNACSCYWWSRLC